MHKHLPSRRLLRIKHIVLGAAAGMAIVASTIPSAYAAGPLTVGTPGASTCVGQTEAYFAQFGNATKFPNSPGGIAGSANWAQLSPQMLQELIYAYCKAG
jgi:hypothetical protein